MLFLGQRASGKRGGGAFYFLTVLGKRTTRPMAIRNFSRSRQGKECGARTSGEDGSLSFPREKWLAISRGAPGAGFSSGGIFPRAV